MREGRDFKAIQVFLKALAKGLEPESLNEPAYDYLLARIGKETLRLEDVREFLQGSEADLDGDERRNVELSLRAVELIKRFRKNSELPRTHMY